MHLGNLLLIPSFGFWNLEIERERRGERQRCNATNDLWDSRSESIEFLPEFFSPTTNPVTFKDKSLGKLGRCVDHSVCLVCSG